MTSRSGSAATQSALTIRAVAQGATIPYAVQSSRRRSASPQIPPTARPGPVDQRSQRKAASPAGCGPSKIRCSPTPAASAALGTSSAQSERQGIGRDGPSGGGSNSAGSATLLRLAAPGPLAQEGRLEIVDGVDVDVAEAVLLQRHLFQLEAELARVGLARFLAPLDLAPDDVVHLARMVGEAGGEMPGALHRHEPRLEQIADLQPVHLPPLGDIELVTGHRIAHAHLPFLGAGKEPAQAAILIEGQPRLRAAEQTVLVLRRHVPDLFPQVTFH